MKPNIKAEAGGLVVKSEGHPVLPNLLIYSHNESEVIKIKRYGNLFDKITSFDNLLSAAKEAIRGKRTKSAPAEFQFNLELNLLSLQNELLTEKYHPGNYNTFFIHDPKKRLISAAPYRDRVIHHAICRIIEPIFDRIFIYDSYANRRGKGTHRALNRCTEYSRKVKYALKCDVEKFFPSIDHNILLEVISRKIKCPRTLSLIKVIIESSNPQEQVTRYFPGDDLFTPFERQKGIPIGNLTSQLFGNIILNPMDHYIKEVKRCEYYIRYSDDFLILEDNKMELHSILDDIREFLIPYRLMLHPRKCVVLRVQEGIPFLGWRVFPAHRRLRRSTGIRMQRNLKELAKTYKKGEVNLERVKATIASYVGHLSHGDTWRLREKLFEETVFTR